MSGHESHPPGGGTPPPPGWSPAPPPGRPTSPAPVHGWPPAQQGFVPAPVHGAAHKPGAVPLRPLGVGDVFDAAFRIIRFNPGATVGSAVLVTALAMALPLLVTAVLTWTVGAPLGGSSTSPFGPFGATPPSSSASPSASELAGTIGSFGSLAVGSLLRAVGLILATGMVAHVTAAAALGRRLDLAQAWAATRGRRWRLIGLTLLLGLAFTLAVAVYAVSWVVAVLLTDGPWPLVVYGVVSVPAFVAALVWAWVRLAYLPVPVLMLEQVGVLHAIGRGYRLTRRQFWRIFGIALLTGLVAQVAGSMLSLPVSLLGQLGLAGIASTRYAMLGMVALQTVTAVLASAFVVPFTAAVTSLQYLDQRMRKEAYDVELMARAGLTDQPVPGAPAGPSWSTGPTGR